MSSELDKLIDANTRSEAATEVLYPDGSGPDGRVNSGLPAEPQRSVDGPTGIPPDKASPDDIPAPARKTLGDYLNQVTSKNITPVNGPSGEDTVPAATVITRGSAAFDANIPEPDSFDHGSLLDGKKGPNGTANTGLRDVNNSTDSTFGAYLNPSNEIDGTALGNISAALKTNRFNPGGNTPYMSGPNQRSNTRWSNVQKTSGDSAAATLGKYDKDLQGLKMLELQRVAEQLLLNAVGDKETQFGSTSGDAIGPAGGATSFFQLGRGRSQDSGVFDADIDFRPANAVRAAINSERGQQTSIQGQMAANLESIEEDLASNEGYKRKTYGAMNNHLERFAPALPTSMIVLAAIASLASVIAAIVLSLLLDLIGLAFMLFGGDFVKESTYKKGNPAQMAMGSAFGDNDYGSAGMMSRLPAFFGLPQLEADYPGLSTFAGLFPFTNAALVGSLEFFIGNTFIGLSPQIASISAGYYVVVVRNALRDLDQIQEAASDMSGGGLIGAVEGFFALVDAFRSSATFKFLVTLITIGDRILCGPGLFNLRENDGSGQLGLDKLPENEPGAVSIASLAQRSSRLQAGSPTLSYAISQLPQVYIRPREEFIGHTVPAFNGTTIPMDHLGDEFPLGKPEEDGHILMKESKVKAFNEENFQNRLIRANRIPTHLRESLEAELDSYYVPFYFHDMRTNEIVPLPCFVENISDSYSPAITEVKGFGRMDPVMIYSSTTRKIGMSFYVVSTSPDDYSQMYMAVNKLVSMVYPQWGAGRRVQNSLGQKFDVPYSNVQTASPLIRIRLGELFASNRAPENVRRLFGAHKPGFSVGGTGGLDPNDEGRPANLDDIALLEADAVKYLGTAQAVVAGVLSRKDWKKSSDGFWGIWLTTVLSVGKEIDSMTAFVNGVKANLKTDTAETAGAAVVKGKGAPWLLPEQVIVNIKPGKKYPAVFLKGGKWKFVRRHGLRFDSMAQGRIINYAYKGGMFGTKLREKEKKGLIWMKNKIYYVMAPVDGTSFDETAFAPVKDRDNPYVGIAVPIDDVFQGSDPISKQNTRMSLVTHHDVVGLQIPNPFKPPPPEPLFDTKFMKENPITIAKRTSGGNGLAGFITSLDFDWNIAPWETNQDLGRAPQYCKVTLSFSPIHDEPLGLNEDGSLRAAAYPVGEVITSIMGQRFQLVDDPGGPEVENLRRLLALKAEIVAKNLENKEDDGDPSGPE